MAGALVFQRALRLIFPPKNPGPFPADEIVKAMSKLKAVAVLDRSESFSDHGGPVFNEVRSALYDAKRQPLVINYIYGLTLQ